MDGAIRRSKDEEPPAVKIVQYVNDWGKVTWGVVFADDGDPGRYERSSDYINNPRIIWTRRPT